ncbi:MAG: DNA repair protein RecO [Woeseia sp.]|mgnify:FL=1|nr:DNA repair protein RecO [Woeseia sp.]
MSTNRRVHNQPAWLLHHRPFRDSSRILDVFSQDYGMISLVSRGSRSGRSKLKGILRPFLPLQISWIMRSDLGTLTGAEMGGSPISLAGDALLSGYYVNELIINLLHRHDPQPELFSLYEATITQLNSSALISATLRRFEIEALALLGYALNLHHDTQTGGELTAEVTYQYHVDQGPVAADGYDDSMTFLGSELQAIARYEFSNPETLNNAARLLRSIISWHLNGKELKSRRVFKEMRIASERAG